LATIFQAGYKELQRLMDKERQKSTHRENTTTDLGSLVPPQSSIENLERSLTAAARRETLKLESSMTFLATAASTAPFIGLFGTVWGIMNAFQNIGAQGGASLATVAPGIAEALIATAVGLACAIPATMGYNYFNNKLRGIRARMENFGADFLNIIKRNFLGN
jgi:biopolymer transport protein TolQ